MTQVLTQSLTQLIQQITSLEERLRTFQTRCAQLELLEDDTTVRNAFLRRIAPQLTEQDREELEALLTTTPEEVKRRLLRMEMDAATVKTLGTPQVPPQVVVPAPVEERVERVEERKRVARSLRGDSKNE